MRHPKPVFAILALLASLVGCSASAPDDSGKELDVTQRFHPMLPTHGPTAIPDGFAPTSSRNQGGPPALPTFEEGKSAEPQTQPLEPLIDDNRQVTLTLVMDGAAPFSLSRKKFPRPRACTVFISSFRQDGVPGLLATPAFGSTTELWMLGRLRYGVGAVTHDVTFDIPLGRELAIPVVAENIELSARLIGAQQGDPLGFVVSPGWGQSLFTTPPQLPNPGLSNTIGPLPPGLTLASPVVISGFMSEEYERPQEGGSQLYRAWRIHFIAAGTANVPIALGAASVVVNGDASGGGSWAFLIFNGNTSSVNQMQNLPFNAAPIAIPDNAVAIVVTSGVGGPTTGIVEVIEYTGL